MKGKPWEPNQEKLLRQLVKAKEPLAVISKRLGLSEDSVRKKCDRIGLVVVDRDRRMRTTTSIPRELPTVEEALKILGGALVKASEAGLDKVEVQRLHVVATIAKTYKEFFADYVDYRGIEADLAEMKAKYDELARAIRGPPLIVLGV